MQLYGKILVAVDSSLQSRLANDMAVFLSKLFSSQVTIVHVVSNELPALTGELYSPREDTVPVNQATYQFPRAVRLYRPNENVFPNEVINEMTERLRENGQTLLAENAAVYAQYGMTATAKLLEGASPAETIVEEAQVGAYDLIVLGNSGGEETEPNPHHLGSVADAVAMTSKIPVLVVRDKIRIAKILVAVDGSSRDEKTLQHASEIAKKSGGKLTLLHVQEKSLLRLRPEIEQIGKHILQRAAEKVGVEVEQRLLAGDPAKVAISLANQENFDLVIVGTGKLGAVKHFLLGNVADHVLHHASVPVLIVK